MGGAPAAACETTAKLRVARIGIPHRFFLTAVSADAVGSEDLARASGPCFVQRQTGNDKPVGRRPSRSRANQSGRARACASSAYDAKRLSKACRDKRLRIFASKPEHRIMPGAKRPRARPPSGPPLAPRPSNGAATGVKLICKSPLEWSRGDGFSQTARRISEPAHTLL